MPRPRKSPGERQRARQQAVERYNASDKGKACRKRYRQTDKGKAVQAMYDANKQADLIRAVAAEQQAQAKRQEIRDDSGRLIAVRLPDGTIQAVTDQQETDRQSDSDDSREEINR